MITPDEQEHLLTLASKIAWRFKKRASWVDVEDFVQVAWQAFVEADRNYDPIVGVPKWKYLERAATIACTHAMYRGRSPVHASNGTVRKLAEYRKVDVEAMDARTTDMEATVEDLEWRAQVRAAVSFVCAATRDGDLASPVLLDERAPADVARTHGVEVMRIYEACRRVRKGIAHTPSLYALARDKLRS